MKPLKSYTLIIKLRDNLSQYYNFENERYGVQAAGEQILLVECKISRRSLGKKKLQRLRALAEKIGAQLILATKSRKKNIFEKFFRKHQL